MSALVKQIIPKKTREEIYTFLIENSYESDKSSTDAVYLGYLCAKGDIYNARDFVNSLENKKEVLNIKHILLYSGTVLHIAMFWNSGDIGRQFFHLLWSNGAEFVIDYYNQFPFEQLDYDLMWLTPIEYINCGERDNSEFFEFYQEIKTNFYLNRGIG